MALQLLVCSMSAMEIAPVKWEELSWHEMVQIARNLHSECGENLDVHELLWEEIKRPQLPARKDSIPRLIRRITNEKIGDGIKFACNKLLGIRKVSSCP